MREKNMERMLCHLFLQNRKIILIKKRRIIVKEKSTVETADANDCLLYKNLYFYFLFRLFGTLILPALTIACYINQIPVLK
jgi:hypothetical protein